MHPAFPAIVALWFAVLFGLGSLVLPPILVERAVAVTGIDALIPAAAPPLGTTARIAIASAMALFGALLGFVIAQRVASAQAAARPARTGGRPYDDDVFQDLAIRRPISAHDELGSTRLETQPDPDPGMDDWFQPPAVDENDRSGGLLRTGPFDDVEIGKPAMIRSEPDPLDLAKFEQPQPPPLRDPDLQRLSPVVRPFASPPPVRLQEHAHPTVSTPATPSPVARAACDADAESEPLAFFAPSQTGETETKEAVQAPREPLDQLSMADLAERLAGSLGRMGGTIAPPSAELAAALSVQLTKVPLASGAGSQVVVPEMEPTPDAVDFAPVQAFGRLQGQPVPPPPVIPAALRPLPFEVDEFGEDDDELDLNLSFVKSASSPESTPAAIRNPLDEAIAIDDEADEDEDDPVAQSAAFGSLLAMKGPSKGNAGNARAEEPEALPSDPQPRRFDTPGNFAAIGAPSTDRARVDQEEADRALRSALATLQRMSGAA